MTTYKQSYLIAGGLTISSQANATSVSPLTADLSAQPVLSKVSYNADTGLLILTGSHFTGAANAYTVTDLSFSGDNQLSYTLSSASSVVGTPGSTRLSIQVSKTDQQYLDGLLNKNGSHAADGVAYSLSAASGWQVGANAVSVGNVSVAKLNQPIIASVSYNAATGVFAITGSHLTYHGNSNTSIAVADFSFSGIHGKYAFNSLNDTVSSFITTGNVSSFYIQLNSADQASVNSLVADNGKSSQGHAYKLAVSAHWDSDSGAAASKAVTVSGLLPSITHAGYDAGTGVLSLSGHNFTKALSDYLLTNLSITGDGNNSYSLSQDSIVKTVADTALTIKLSSADQLAVDGLLNKNGILANDGSTHYQISAAAGWDAGAAAADTALTVKKAALPSLNKVSYDAATGVFTITGNHLANHGSSNGIALANFSLTTGNGSYTFSASDDSVSQLSTKRFSINLSSTDQATVNSLLSDNGKGPLGQAYNLAATANWDSDSGAKIKTLAVNVSGLPTVVTDVIYKAGSGILSLIGNNLPSNAKAYHVSALTIADATTNTSYTLKDASVIKGKPNTDLVNIQLSASDKAAADKLFASAIDHSGFGGSDGTDIYDLNAESGWVTGAGAISAETLTVIASQPLLGGGNPGSTTNLNSILGFSLIAPLATTSLVSAKISLDQALTGNPVTINSFLADSGQLELSPTVYTAFTGINIDSNHFSNATTAASPNDYLYYDANTGGLYYDPNGSNPGAAVEIAIIGTNTHPASLSPADFTLLT